MDKLTLCLDATVTCAGFETEAQLALDGDIFTPCLDATEPRKGVAKQVLLDVDGVTLVVTFAAVVCRGLEREALVGVNVVMVMFWLKTAEL